MTRTRSLHRLTLAALSAAALTLSIAPVAQAGQSWARWKHDNRGYPSNGGWNTHRVVYRDSYHGGAGPALAGLIGGFVLGATLTHPQPVYVVHEPVCAPPVTHYYYRSHATVYVAPPAPHYRYEDGNGERWWDTLEECGQAALGSDGPRVIRVIDDRDNRCVQTYYWKHDHFISDDDPAYDDRGQDRDDYSRDN